MSQCRSCGAEIEWCEMASTGKNHPVDVTPDPRGQWVVVVGKMRKATPEDDKLGRERRTSHFATCPDAGSWRGR